MKKAILLSVLSLVALPWISAARGFTPLLPIPAPQIINLPANTPGGNFSVTNLIDGNLKSEFASTDLGTNTVVEFDLGQPTVLTALRHVDRNDSATVAESRLDVLDDAGALVRSIKIVHVNKRSGVTPLIFPEPATGSRLRWQVTRLGSPGLLSVGGAELSFFTSAATDAEPLRDRVIGRVLPFLQKDGNQTLKLTVSHSYAEPAKATLALGNAKREVELKWGTIDVDWQIPASKTSNALPVSLSFGSHATPITVTQNPPRELTIYILPHSHTDIGYTEIQSAVEKKQVENILKGIAAARKTADYPEGAKFVWNVEVAWAADLFLQRMDDRQKADFIDAVSRRQVVLNGMYVNELTGLCRPEELIHLFRFGTKMADATGVPIESAMISDVPGYTWGTVTAMSQAGIKYLSAAPNYFDRVGDILQQQENKPFYWVGPDGTNKVLVWIPFWGYAMSHIYLQLSPHLIEDFYDGLKQKNYPYDIAYVRWAGHGDNATPDPAICDFVRDWNAKYAWPKFIISGTSEPFRALEKRYGSAIPVVHGDLTPYWEDGAASSALETAQNRRASDRLTQASALFAMNGISYPAEQFEEAWRDVLLFDEHTWGAAISISDPERKETLEQWAIKRAYATNAAAKSETLLAQALFKTKPGSDQFSVVNSLSWLRSEPVTLSHESSRTGDRVLDHSGKPVPSQRLADGRLQFLASDVPPLGSGAFSIASGSSASPEHPVRITENSLNNGILHIVIDPKTGNIIEFKAKGIPENLAADGGLNAYAYLIGDDPRNVQSDSSVHISIGEHGPLIGSLIVESSAPGCNLLRRELRLCANEDCLHVINFVDKKKLEAKSYYSKEGKESLNFDFPFNVPDGDVFYDTQFGVVQAEKDQLPGSCKNWLAINRWAAISNGKFSVNLVTLDAPLIEPGYLSATLLNSQTNPDIWRKHITRTQRLYSWAMNNHWGTNYRAHQEGPTIFEYLIQPYAGPHDSAAATRLALAAAQPLLVSGSSSEMRSLFTVDNADILTTALKPSDDGKAMIIRIYNSASEAGSAHLDFAGRQPKALYVSDTGEHAGSKAGERIKLPGHGLIALRAEF